MIVYLQYQNKNRRQRISGIKEMNTSTYRELSKTEQGRKQAHEMMLEDVKKRIDKFVNEAPESTREKASQLMQAAFEKYPNLATACCLIFCR